MSSRVSSEEGAMEGLLKGLINIGIEAVQDFAAGNQNADNSQSNEADSRKEEEEQPRSRWDKHKHQQAPDEYKQAFKRNASDQDYSEGVDSSSINLEPTDEELSDYRVACSRLWDLDIDRLVPGRDYEIDCGDGKRVYSKEDMASNELFRFVSQDVFKRPTYARFYALLDNYHADQDVAEEFSSREEQEQIAFVEEISRTAPIQYLFKYLVASRAIQSDNWEEFKRMLQRLWFDLYRRDNTRDSSSAFEHVFVGEIKDRENNDEEVSGLHNWIQFYIEEAKGSLDYQGYILPRRRGGDEPDSHTQLVTVQFTWNGARKPASSSFIGVSPEFELALYTLCFFCGDEDNHLVLGSYGVNVKCYRYGRNRIGSVFPIAEE
ncbi:poly(U)-specific endoribonuclease-B [Selaginella moellendorffii]|nr:poly(U)-specific endoribonuclease-B [Selaginella moellendorffii]|eukprot:XP_002964623.2 poly(U)-specific endoribonuclease-B [Selaginella moellendorffii]